MASPSVDTARRWFALHRRPVAAACTFLAVLLALGALTRSPAPASSPVIVDESAAVVPDGQLAVPLRLGDAAVAALLHPGDRVDVLAADSRTGAEVVASDVTVRAVPAGDDSPWSEGAGLVVVSATPAQALALAAAAGATLTIAVHPG